jgi:hypothetical protein
LILQEAKVLHGPYSQWRWEVKFYVCNMTVLAAHDVQLKPYRNYLQRELLPEVPK